MPNQGLMSNAQMPEFSLMGLLLGGRGYAADWYGQRDKLKLAQNMDQADASQRASASQGILASPEFAAAVKDPEQRAQYGLWGQFQGANVPATMAATGNSLLTQAVGSLQNRANLQFSSDLQRQNMDYGAQVELDTAQKKLEQTTAYNQRMLNDVMKPDAVTGEPNVQAMMRRASVLKSQGYDIPGDFGVSMDPQRGMVLQPLPGTKTYEERMGQMQTQGNLVEGGQQLLDHWSGKKVMDRGSYNATKALLTDAYRVATKAGTMDEGMQKMMDNIIPNLGYTGTDVPGWAKEQMRTFVLTQQRDLGQMQDRFNIPLNQIPLRTTQQQVPDLDDKVVEENNRIIQQQNKDTAQPEQPRQRWDRGKPEAQAPGTGLLDTPGGQPARTRAWR